MVESSPTTLDYALPSNQLHGWWRRHRKLVRRFVVCAFCVIVVGYSSPTITSYTADNPATLTATRWHEIAVFGRTVHRCGTPTRFKFAHLVAPMEGEPLPPTLDVMIYREMSQTHILFYAWRSPHYYQCVSGIGRVESVRDGILFLSQRLPDATPEERRNVLAKIVNRARNIDGVYHHVAQKQFEQIAQQAVREFEVQSGRQ